VPPPQSTPVSAPSRTPSVHEGAAQRPLTHEPTTQSLPTRQARPSAQGAQVPPPQSTSVSLPSLRPSRQGSTAASVEESAPPSPSTVRGARSRAPPSPIAVDPSPSGG
jgi:hypothetical protein